MSSEKVRTKTSIANITNLIVDQILTPTFSFGDVSRDEINALFNTAGLSLTPPTKV